MKIKYSYTFGLPKKVVWKMIMNETVVRNSITGCKSFVERTSGVYQAEIDIKYGIIKDSFTLDVRRLQEKSPTYCQLHVKGIGNLGEIDATADLFLKEIVQGETMLTISAEGQGSGALTLAARKVVNSGTNKSLDSFFQKIEKEIKKSLYKSRR